MSTRTSMATLCCLLLFGCHRVEHTNLIVQTGGDPQRGAAVIRQVGCGSCHTIPGVRGANGRVGPPLFFFSERTYIAGRVPNTPANLIAWIKDAQSIEPGTAMPKLGLSDQQARDAAAYLYTLE